MKMKSLLVAVVALGLTGFAMPAAADPIDLSANMTIDNSTFKSGELNSQAVAITFPLVTDNMEDLLYIDLPVGYVLSASADIDIFPQNYDPATGICGTVDTGITVPLLDSDSYTCSTGGSDFPFEFVIQGNVPSASYIINLAPNSFRALTTQVDVTDHITISVEKMPKSWGNGDFGSVSVTTLAPVLPSTGLDVFSTAAAGALTGLAGLLAIVFVAARRRARN